MRLTLDDPNFKRLMNGLGKKAPLLTRQMALNVLGNIGAMGRYREQQQANTLGLGRVQHTVRERVVIERQMLVKTKAGWVSTTRMGADGRPFRMASFGYEVPSAPKSAKAGYTSQLANLWAHETEPYKKNSPFVGRAGKKRTFWAEGLRRPAKYKWSVTEDILSQTIPRAVARTEKEFSKKWEEL